MDQPKRTDKVRLGGRRWYDRLAGEFKSKESKLHPVGDAYRNLDLLLSETTLDSPYFTDQAQAISFASLVYSAYRDLRILPSLLEEYVSAIELHTKRASLVKPDPNDPKREISTLDEEVMALGQEEMRKITDFGNKIQSCYDGLLGLDRKMKKLAKLTEAMRKEPDSNQHSKLSELFYGGWIKSRTIMNSIKELLGYISELSQYQVFSGREIAFFPFEKLRKME
ncbi:MAG TPA: hypothetical protein VJA23_05390 [Candidatus Nanoarchaeia archaeon]|nr:hypothetical protein [Candidatus Nanoarchaeia archaeon]